ncbi:MAG TPA: rhomboid family intramembrane serine protease [Deltaproteobacteria bacterium]|nr:rhomboid family intramembrane serine protease [Deltaproteobacteria bacterium]
MFIPIGDSPNPRNFTPWVNYSLIMVNVGVFFFITLPLSSQGVDINDPMLREFLRHIADSLPSGVSLRQVLASISAYDLFTYVHGYKPGAPQIGDLFFSMFLHGGLLHLVGNMLFLWIYGDNVEHRIGRLGYLVTYLATGVAATLFFSGFAGSSMTPLVGASGAISGILGLYFLLFPRNKVKVFIALFPIYFNVLLLPARWVLGFYLLVDNMLPFLIGAGSSVAFGAHIGGFLAGFGIAWAGERLAWQWPWRDTMRHIGTARGPDTSVNTSEESSLVLLREALMKGRPSDALDAVSKMDRDEIAQLRPDECVILAGWLDEKGHPIAASTLLRRCIATHQKAENLADVYLALGLMRLKQGQPTAAYQYLLNVFEHNPSPETAQRAHQALSQINIYCSAH